ncbi:MAG: HNH endonuclease [Candidatus Thermoplasmatota archaeon]|nr:HNH endonuclease [Candidatus Thermoplasmatota archaeon]
MHHIDFLSESGSNGLSNLITLCKDCHAMQHPHMQERS